MCDEHGSWGAPLANALPICVATEVGASIMQPKVLRGTNAWSKDHRRTEGHRRSDDHRRAEAAGAQQRRSSEARLWDELWLKLIRTAGPTRYAGSASWYLLTMRVLDQHGLSRDAIALGSVRTGGVP